MCLKKAKQYWIQVVVGFHQFAFVVLLPKVPSKYCAYVDYELKGLFTIQMHIPYQPALLLNTWRDFFFLTSGGLDYIDLA